MKGKTVITLLCALVIALFGCERKPVTSSVSAGTWDVNSDTGITNGRAFGIDFRVAGTSGAEVTSERSGNPKYSSRVEITLADDLKIELETMDQRNSVAFKLNGNNLGNLQRGDEVAIDEDRNVTVNGENPK